MDLPSGNVTSTGGFLSHGGTPLALDGLLHGKSL